MEYVYNSCFNVLSTSSRMSFLGLSLLIFFPFGSYFPVCLVIFYWMANIVNFMLLGSDFGVPLSILELCSGLI